MGAESSRQRSSVPHLVVVLPAEPSPAVAEREAAAASPSAAETLDAAAETATESAAAAAPARSTTKNAPFDDCGAGINDTKGGLVFSVVVCESRCKGGSVGLVGVCAVLRQGERDQKRTTKMRNALSQINVPFCRGCIPTRVHTPSPGTFVISAVPAAPFPLATKISGVAGLACEVHCGRVRVDPIGDAAKLVALGERSVRHIPELWWQQVLVGTPTPSNVVDDCLQVETRLDVALLTVYGRVYHCYPLSSCFLLLFRLLGPSVFLVQTEC
ncbi:MAG: hypothetical protein BJ554DRAFT_3718, partial [Olpidium bornovanus]